MRDELNARLEHWLSDIATRWAVEIEEADQRLGGVGKHDEVQGRLKDYPRLGLALSPRPRDIKRFADTAQKCWALGQRYVSMRFNRFVEDSEAKRVLLLDLSPYGE